MSIENPPQDCQPERPFGLPLKTGRISLKQEDWTQINDFIHSRKWLSESPALESDKADPLLERLPPYGSLLMGFDFHLSPEGPKLIEVNTNAGGLATVFTFPKFELAQQAVRDEFLSAIKTEYRLARGPDTRLTSVAIVDDNVKSQGLYPEMVCFAELLKKDGIETVVVSPEELESRPTGLFYRDLRIDLIYNRMTDFRLTSQEHAHIRAAILADDVVITPHPAVYVRSADKRLLPQMKHQVVPPTFLLKDRPIEEWQKDKKLFVFKPPAGNASKGVYRGDKLSVSKLKLLPPDTIVQQYVPPPIAEDETKFDVRVFTRDTDIIGIASRHFTGQVMEMSSAKAGFQEALPLGVCCLPCLSPSKCAEVMKKWAEYIKQNVNNEDVIAQWRPPGPLSCDC